MVAEFTTTLSELIGNITTVGTFFLDMFVDVADMLFNSPFIIFIGISIVLVILGTAAGFLRIKRGGRRRR